MNAYAKKIERTLTMPWIYTAFKMFLVIALSRTQIIGTYPFGIAYAAAFAEENALCAVIALAAGIAQDGADAVKYLLSALIYGVIVIIRKFKNTQVKAVALGSAVSIASAVSLFSAGATPARIILILPEAFLVGSLYQLFAGENREGILAYGKEIIITGACLGGLYGLETPYIGADAALFLGMIIIMSVSYSCGIPAAVLTGAALGFMIFIKSPSAVEMAGTFAIAAAVSSVLSRTGKTGTGAGFLSGVTVSVLCMGDLGALSVSDIFTAPVIFLLLPETVAVKIGSRINNAFYSAEHEGEGEMIAERLKTVAQAVGDLGNGVKILSRDRKEKNDIFEPVRERVCRGCPNQTRCFGEREFAYGMMQELKQAMERDGCLSYSNAPKRFCNSCIRSEKMLSEFSHMYELYKQNELYKGEAVFDRNIAVNQYGEFSSIINGLSQTVAVMPKTETESERYEVSAAVCQESGDGQETSGDTVMHFKNGNKYFVILCDGMGSGRTAHEISSLAARLFAEFLCSGIDKKSAVNMINSALALNADRESFSSADILEIDLVTGEAEFLKIGSAQSFIKRGHEIEEISSSALPIGILENIKVVPQRRMLTHGDMILMVSDGIGEASSGVMKNDWIKKLFLSGTASDGEMAKRFLEGAKSRAVYRDDMTSVVIRIKTAE